MYAQERHQEIVTLAQDLGRVSVTELATRYNVTPETIRRDLDALTERGLLSRVHGGAVPVNALKLTNVPLRAREAHSKNEKQAIGAHAASLLPQEGRDLTVLMDSGTTVAQMCAHLPKTISVVLTNSIPAATELSQREGIEVHLLGGTVEPVTQTTVSTEALSTIKRLSVDFAFMGANGFSVHHGFSTPQLPDAAIKHAMVKAARHTFVLADATKFGRDHLAQFAGLGEVDALVTDSRLAEMSRDALEGAGLHLRIA